MFLGSEVVFAAGAAKRTSSTVKDELFLVGEEVIFIGSASYWNASYDPFVDSPLNLLDSYLPSASAALTHLDEVNIALGSRAYLQARTNSTNTVSGVTTHSVDWLKVQIGSLEFSGFGTNVVMKTAVGDSPPYPYATVDTVCSGINPCDWLWLQAISPTTVSPPGTSLTLDSSLSGSEQYGVNLYAGADIGTLPSVTGAVETTAPSSGESLYVIDLIVPDLPAAWTALYGSNVRIGVYLEYGVFYYGVYVPAMSLRGGAVLVIAVLAAGILALALPRKRAA